MKRKLCLTALITVLCPLFLFAHGVEVSEISDSDAVRTLRFMYSTGEPMAYAKVRVFPPAKLDTEVLQTITTWNGYFSFVPDEDGDWLIKAEDGMGHMGSMTISVQSLETGAASAGVSAGDGLGSAPLVLRLLLGLSLILNVFAVYSFILSRSLRKKQERSYAH
jgi:nickel transport protein